MGNLQDQFIHRANIGKNNTNSHFVKVGWACFYDSEVLNLSIFNLRMFIARWTLPAKKAKRYIGSLTDITSDTGRHEKHQKFDLIVVNNSD
jgi:hypothetical protein